MRIRILALLSLLIITAAGFTLKLYKGPGQGWFNNYAAGAVYEVFWCLTLFFIWARRECILRIVVTVFLVTSLLELLQLWHPPVLEAIRGTFVGRTLVGTTFSWWDFPHYVLGCGLGWLWIQCIIKSEG